MKFIGLLMINHEDDILEDTLALHSSIVDCFYVLDGTVPNDDSQVTCRSNPKCAGYATDADLPRPPYPKGTTCGYRKYPHEMAVADHGADNWFLELHGDEVWTFDPHEVVEQNPEADGFIFPLPCYFPREEDGWDNDLPALDQLKWSLGPGWPEFRMFRGSAGVHFTETQHFNTMPSGIRNIVTLPNEIRHYPYRSPRVQRERAQIHQRTKFDPDNYQHIVRGDVVLWNYQMVAHWRRHSCFHELRHDAEQPAYDPDAAPKPLKATA